VCGYPRRTLKFRSNGGFTYTIPEREGGRARVVDGVWSAPAASMPWVDVGVRGKLSTAQSVLRPSQAASERVEGAIEVASVEELGPNGVRSVLDAWGRGHADRIDCITEELGVWREAWKTLLANEALVVRSTDGNLDIVDLVWRERGL
jgi:hypothetical protein